MYFHVYPYHINKDNCFCTVQEALDASRSSNAEEKSIIIHEGEYYNIKTRLTAEDSNLTIKAADGETPVLYGGKLCTNWTQLDDQLWETDYDSGNMEINMLFVDDIPASLACLPENGYFQHLSRFEGKWQSTTYGGWDRKPTQEELTTLKVKPDDLATWSDYDNARVRIFHQWNESISGIKSVNTQSGDITLTQPCAHPPGAFYMHDGNEKAINYQVENSRAGLTRPGKWYYNKVEKKLVYWPLAEQDPNKLKIIIPTTKTILDITGSSSITLDGITFSCTGVSDTPVSFGANFASTAVFIKDTKEKLYCKNLKITQVGGKALEIENTDKDSSCDVRVEGCDIRKCGGPGLYVFAQGANVMSNRIVDTGLYYQSSLALKVTGKQCDVRKNILDGCPYTAITGGGQNAIFAENTVRNFMRKLDDGGAFYFFAGNHLIIKNNKVYGSFGRLAHAYYLDERSEGCIVEDNYAENTASCFHGHMAKDCVFRHNNIQDRNDTLITFARCEDFVLEKNIFNVQGSIKIKMPPGAIKEFINNEINSKNDVQHLVLTKDGYDVINKRTGSGLALFTLGGRMCAVAEKTEETVNKCKTVPRESTKKQVLK